MVSIPRFNKDSLGMLLAFFLWGFSLSQTSRNRMFEEKKARRDYLETVKIHFGPSPDHAAFEAP